MKNSLETKLGIFVVLAVLAAWLIIETLGSTDLFHHGYRITAQFENAQDLKVGDRVKMAGVEIGRVEKIALTESRVALALKLSSGATLNTNLDSLPANLKVGDAFPIAGGETGQVENISTIPSKVSVQMKLRDEAIVRSDSKATIKFTGLMGQNFVSIDFGSPTSERVKGGMNISGVEQADLSAVMAKLDNAAGGIENITKNFAGNEIKNMFGALDNILTEKKDAIKLTLENVKSISGQIASGQGTIGKLIYTDTLHNSALDTVSNLQATVVSAHLAIDDARAGKGTIGKLLTDETLYNSATASMTNLNSILLKVNQGDGTIGKLVNDQEFYKNAKLSLQKLDKAADGLEDQGPLSVLSIMANNLF
jgi:phospholipid/cholesterol/gamma-HCH transport system substrate-binding protein